MYKLSKIIPVRMTTDYVDENGHNVYVRWIQWRSKAWFIKTILA